MPGLDGYYGYHATERPSQKYNSCDLGALTKKFRERLFIIVLVVPDPRNTNTIRIRSFERELLILIALTASS